MGENLVRPANGGTPPPGFGPNPPDLAGLNLLRLLTGRADEILFTLQASLVSGMAKGERALDLASRVETNITVDRSEAVSIARNYVGFAVVRVRWEESLQIGFTHKTWLCGKTCPILGHGVAAERYRTPIPIMDPFIVNGIPLMYALDFLSGHPDQCIDCQCMTSFSRPPG